MDSPVRDYVRIGERSAQTVTPGRMAARQPRKLRGAVAGKKRSDARRCARPGGGYALGVPTAAAGRLRLEPVPLLSEFRGLSRRLRCVGKACAARRCALSAGSVSLRRTEHGELNVHQIAEYAVGGLFDLRFDGNRTEGPHQIRMKQDQVSRPRSCGKYVAPVQYFGAHA